MGLKLNGATSGSIELDPQANLGSDRVITLNATGNSTLTLPDANGTLDRLERAGNILQVVSVTKTNTFSASSGTVADVPGLQPTITPTSTSSKILILTDVAIAAESGGHRAAARVIRRIGGVDSTITEGDANGSRARTMWASHLTQLNGFMHRANIQHLDSPNSTNPITYVFQLHRIDAGTITVNLGYNDVNASSHGAPISSVTLLEVAA